MTTLDNPNNNNNNKTLLTLANTLRWKHYSWFIWLITMYEALYNIHHFCQLWWHRTRHVGHCRTGKKWESQTNKTFMEQSYCRCCCSCCCTLTSNSHKCKHINTLTRIRRLAQWKPRHIHLIMVNGFLVCVCGKLDNCHHISCCFSVLLLLSDPIP